MQIKKAGKEVTTHIVETKAPYISYDRLEKTDFSHNAFSTRVGGVSEGIFESMNLSWKMGDDIQNVKRNFEIFISENGFKNPVLSDQTHTTNVLRVSKEDSGINFDKERRIKDIDGLITNEPEVTLVTSYADCVPLYFADEENRAIGLSHSGWRGSVGRIGENTIKAMEREFGTNPKKLTVAIGPSICVNCYEVSEDVAFCFLKEFNETAADYDKIENKEIIAQDMSKIVYKKADGKYMLNLWAANYRVFKDAGVKTENIIIPDMCTCCNKDILFSHRGHNKKRGNLCAFLMMKQKG